MPNNEISKMGIQIMDELQVKIRIALINYTEKSINDPTPLTKKKVWCSDLTV